jgi:acyl-CoA synthetase (AMP-forming)/AMP-acid ligase II
VARLAKFKRPSTITLVDELPRGATGKVQKGQLRLALGHDQSTTTGRQA